MKVFMGSSSEQDEMSWVVPAKGIIRKAHGWIVAGAEADSVVQSILSKNKTRDVADIPIVSGESIIMNKTNYFMSIKLFPETVGDRHAFGQSGNKELHVEAGDLIWMSLTGATSTSIFAHYEFEFQPFDGSYIEIEVTFNSDEGFVNSLHFPVSMYVDEIESVLSVTETTTAGIVKVVWAILPLSESLLNNPSTVIGSPSPSSAAFVKLPGSFRTGRDAWEHEVGHDAVLKSDFTLDRRKFFPRGFKIDMADNLLHDLIGTIDTFEHTLIFKGRARNKELRPKSSIFIETSGWLTEEANN